jgi:hypothetical protein
MQYVKPFSQQDAIQAFLTHADSCGGDYSDWYVGVAADPERTLFEYHLVEPRGQYMYCRLASFSDAKEAAERCRLLYGTKSGMPFGWQDAIYLYAYRMTTRTRE